MTCITIGIGSNLGNSPLMVARAVSALWHCGLFTDIVASALYTSKALLPHDAPDSWNLPFTNAVIAANTEASPQEVLDQLQAIERVLGKQKRGHWGPREIDLDILTYGQQIIDQDNLHIPHPHLHKRDFVLYPLADIVPDLLHPHMQCSMQTLQAQLPSCKAALHTLPPVAEQGIFGILNVTPDSFSDGYASAPHDIIMAHAHSLLQSGATILDIGAESTRPGATACTAEEEWQRLAPHLPALCTLAHQAGKHISIDTRNPSTAERSLTMGADWINDVSGLHNQAMHTLLARHPHARIVCMHSLDIPANPLNTLPDSINICAHLRAWALERIGTLDAKGICHTRLVMDAGLGFGKTPDQSLMLITQAHSLLSLPVAWLYGHSRKSLFTRFDPTSTPPMRDGMTRLSSHWLGTQHVQYIRVHAP